MRCAPARLHLCIVSEEARIAHGDQVDQDVSSDDDVCDLAFRVNQLMSQPRHERAGRKGCGWMSKCCESRARCCSSEQQAMPQAAAEQP
jgi:hypothetical protein